MGWFSGLGWGGAGNPPAPASPPPERQLHLVDSRLGTPARPPISGPAFAPVAPPAAPTTTQERVAVEADRARGLLSEYAAHLRMELAGPEARELWDAMTVWLSSATNAFANGFPRAPAAAAAAAPPPVRDNAPLAADWESVERLIISRLSTSIAARVPDYLNLTAPHFERLLTERREEARPIVEAFSAALSDDGLLDMGDAILTKWAALLREALPIINDVERSTTPPSARQLEVLKKLPNLPPGIASTDVYGLREGAERDHLRHIFFDMVAGLKGDGACSPLQEMFWAALPGALQVQVTEALDQIDLSKIVGNLLRTNSHFWNGGSSSSGGGRGSQVRAESSDALFGLMTAILQVKPDAPTGRLEALLTRLRDPILARVGGAYVRLLTRDFILQTVHGALTPRGRSSSEPWHRVAEGVFGGVELEPGSWEAKEAARISDFLSGSNGSRVMWGVNGLFDIQTLMTRLYRQSRRYDRVLLRQMAIVAITHAVETITPRDARLAIPATAPEGGMKGLFEGIVPREVADALGDRVDEVVVNISKRLTAKCPNHLNLTDSHFRNLILAHRDELKPIIVAMSRDVTKARFWRFHFRMLKRLEEVMTHVFPTIDEARNQDDVLTRLNRAGRLPKGVAASVTPGYMEHVEGVHLRRLFQAMVESVRGGRRWSATQQIIWSALPGALQRLVTDTLDQTVDPRNFARLVGGALKTYVESRDGGAAAAAVATATPRHNVLTSDEQARVQAIFQALARDSGAVQTIIGWFPGQLLPKIQAQYARVFSADRDIRWDKVVRRLGAPRSAPVADDLPWEQVADKLFADKWASDLRAHGMVQTVEQHLARDVGWLRPAIDAQGLMKESYRRFTKHDRALTRSLAMAVIDAAVDEVFLRPQS